MRKLIICATAIATLGATQAEAQKTKLSVAAFIPARSSSVTYALKPFVERMNAQVGDEVKVEGYWGGALGRNPRKQADLVKDGVTDFGYIVPGYTPGRYPGLGVIELPFMARSGLEGSVAAWRLFEAGLLKGFENFKLVGIFSTEPNHFHTKERIKSINDINGIKVRVAGPVYGSIVKHYKGVPIGMPVTQATEALSRGVVDGVMLGWGGAGVFRVLSIARHTYEAPLGVTALGLLMNKKKLASLSRRVRDAIDINSGERMSKENGAGFDKVAKIFRGKALKSGNKSIPVSAADIATGEKFVQPVHRAWIKNNKNGQAIFDAYAKILADLRAGK